MDIGQYNITKDGDIYKVCEILSGKVEYFRSAQEVSKWIMQDIQEVEQGSG